MGSIVAFILVPLACFLLIALAVVSFACGLTLLIIKIVNKKGNHPKLVYPVSVILIANGIIIAVSAVLFFTKFAGLIASYIASCMGEY